MAAPINWTDEMEQFLIDQFRAGVAPREIAKVLGVSAQAANYRLERLGEKVAGSQTQSKSKPESDRRHVAKMRKCLKCRNEFPSAWAGERTCGPCKSSSEYNLPSQWAGVA